MNRFDLEQEILNCWGITGDIQLLLDAWDNLSEDNKLNILLGIKELYEVKFDKTFRTFEKCVRNGNL